MTLINFIEQDFNLWWVNWVKSEGYITSFKQGWVKHKEKKIVEDFKICLI